MVDKNGGGAPARGDRRAAWAAGPGRGRPGLGPALRRAWIGYQHLLDDHMAAAGFERRFPDGRILHLCARAPDVTISQIGRELGITRQGASKNVERLRARGFVALRPSPTDGREKVVSLTPHAAGYLDAQRRAARTIERRLRLAVGDAPFEALAVLLDALGEHGETRMREYLRERLTGQS